MTPNKEANIENKFQIEDFQNEFGSLNQFSTSEIFHFFKQLNPSISSNTINWRVHDLIRKGILHRVSRGNFALGIGNYYSPIITNNLKSTYNKVKRFFPYTEICVWHTDFLKEFTHNQINFSFTIIEVERDALDSIYLKLKDNLKNVYLNPNINELKSIYTPNIQSIILIPLVTESPLLKINEINTITIEKLLVDLYSDKTWENLQGYEFIRIFETAISKYTILSSKLLRYASRKGKKEEIINILQNYNMAIK